MVSGYGYDKETRNAYRILVGKPAVKVNGKTNKAGE
jgi:hypothetical protein